MFPSYFRLVSDALPTAYASLVCGPGDHERFSPYPAMFAGALERMSTVSFSFCCLSARHLFCSSFVFHFCFSRVCICVCVYFLHVLQSRDAETSKKVLTMMRMDRVPPSAMSCNQIILACEKAVCISDSALRFFFFVTSLCT